MPPTPPVPPGRAPRRGCLRRLLAAAGLLALAALAGLLALKTWRASVDRSLDASWRRSLGGASFLEREEKAKIPRWQIVARLAFPAYWETWPRSARAELEAELTALILEERERLAAGGPPRPFHQRPSRVKGLSWIYEDLPGATTLRLDGDLVYQDEKPVPLRFTVRSGAAPWIFPP